MKLYKKMNGKETVSDKIAGRVPAVPDWKSEGYWGYTSVPEDMCKWWLNLPL